MNIYVEINNQLNQHASLNKITRLYSDLLKNINNFSTTSEKIDLLTKDISLITKIDNQIISDLFLKCKRKTL